LGTIKEDQPFVSMVSFSNSQNFSEFYILISQLAVHTKNIFENNKLSLMICQPENETKNPNSLARITLIGKAIIVEKSNKNYSSIKQNYLNKNLSSEILFNLGDFQIFRIIVEQARFVAGFAKTYNLSTKSLEYLTN
jgi:heme iron utilization protein